MVKPIMADNGAITIAADFVSKACRVLILRAIISFEGLSS